MPLLPHILLVDDDEVNNFLNLRLLKRLQVAQEINTVSSGLKALQFLQDLHSRQQPLPTLIFLDINMPVMDGFEFLHKLTALPMASELPIIIMLTTSSNSKDIDQAKLSPAVAGYLSKPLTEGKVMALLQEHFNEPPRSVN
ncbi:MAG: response regulator [Rufibacter sp.]